MPPVRPSWLDGSPGLARNGAIHALSRSRWPILAATVGALVVLIATASLPTLQTLGLILALGGGLAAARFRDAPVLALSVLAFLAWSSRATVEVGSVNVRVEQPAVLLLGAYLLATRIGLVRALLNRYRFLVAGLGIWMGAALASSLLLAPEPVASLRIVTWWALSLCAAGVAASLAVRVSRVDQLIGALVGVAAIHVAIAALAGVSGRVLGVEWGGFGWTGAGYGFRANGLAWEPNIFASGAAMVIPLACYRYLRTGRALDLLALAVLGFGVWVSLTRTVWVALAIGVAVYGLLLFVRQRSAARAWAPQLAIGVLALFVGTGIGGLFTASLSTTDPGLLAVRPPEAAAGELPPLPTPARPEEPTPAPTAAPTGARPSAPPLIPVDLTSTDNLAFRLVRLRQAVEDVSRSPWIGLGANSFGQRHADPSQNFRPDYLGMLPFTVLYDAGMVGLIGFATFFIGLLGALLRWGSGHLSAAFIASMTIMLASYVMTDALRFATNWLIIGVALGLAYGWRSRQAS